nr:hypothetical protein CFP56_24952 [Quercus suber]
MVATLADLVSNDILLDHTTTIDDDVKEYNEECLEEESTSVVAAFTFQVIIDSSYSLGSSSVASLIDWISNDISHLTIIEVIKSYTEALDEVSTSNACISYNEALEGE